MTRDEVFDFIHNQLKYRGFTLDVPSATWTHPDGHMIREIALVRSKEPVEILCEFLSSCGLL